MYEKNDKNENLAPYTLTTRFSLWEIQINNTNQLAGNPSALCMLCFHVGHHACYFSFLIINFYKTDRNVFSILLSSTSL